MKRAVSILVALLLTVTGATAVIAAGSWGDLGRNLPTSAGADLVVQVAEKSCNNVSFMSRRCHMVFRKACDAKGNGKDHCTQMSGYCHSCTDQYVRCKEAASKRAKGGSERDCGACNEDYGACTAAMGRYYIDKKQ